MYVKKARQVYQDAIDRKLIAENPFRAVKAGSMANAERQVYVTVTASCRESDRGLHGQ
jgi:hypothetical protein